jgi:hypothetical protein
MAEALEEQLSTPAAGEHLRPIARRVTAVMLLVRRCLASFYGPLTLLKPALVPVDPNFSYNWIAQCVYQN